MFETILWWVIVELIGLAVWPLAFRVFRNLPGRGYAFIKPLGLLIVAYLFWLLTTFGFLDNSQGAIALLAILVAGAIWWQFGRERVATNSDNGHTEGGPLTDTPARGGSDGKQSAGRAALAAAAERADVGHGQVDEPTPNGGALVAVRPSVAVQDPVPAVGGYALAVWMREHLALVVTTELVFTIGFCLWAVVRAYMPDITATEKPMEFAFLNGILQSRHFPPQDPWLAGYAISYYYFGYIVMAMLTMVSGIPSSIAFNLAIALLFGLAATGAFGLTYDLITSFRSDVAKAQALFFPLFAPVFLLFAGNLEGLFEALHARGLGSPGFWSWLDVKGLAEAPVNGTFVPTDNWWWWRASRVIHDVVRGQTVEVIDEFPQFSFLLGDMHPHVLALPFVLLALAVALNLLRNTPAGESNEGRSWLELFKVRIANLDFLLVCLVVGSLPFLNFWDVLPYGFIVVAGFAIARYRAGNRWDAAATRDLITFVVSLGAVSLVLFLPFYLGFQSQAGGILPVLFVKTQTHQYLLMFGMFMFVFIAFLARLVYEQRATLARHGVTRALPFVVGVLGFPLLVAVIVALLLVVSPALQDQARAAFADTSGNLFANVMGAYFGPLVRDPWLFVLLSILLVTVLVLLRTRIIDLSGEPALTFVVLLLFTGLLLTFSVEFVYLRDVFGSRMNTVFKFYFQSWTLFSVAGAFAVFYLSRALQGIARGAWFGGLAILLGVSLIYPAEAIPDRAEGFRRTPTLDGIAWIRSYSPGDYAGIAWLKDNAPEGSRILESTGRAYTYDDRMSMATGLPTVLGWIGHEDQWRGGSKLFKNDQAGIDRAADVLRIYQTLDPQEALTLLDKYAINFVVVGQAERSQYSLTQTQIDKFSKVLRLVFENGDLRIYALSQ